MKFCRNKLVPVYITGKEALDKEDVVRLLQESDNFTTKYRTNEDYFYGKHKILDRYFDDTSKPNNQVMCNIPKYIVQVRTGFFSSSPLSLKALNQEFMDDVRDVLDYNDFKQTFNQLDTYCSIYGHSFLVLYINDEGRLAFTAQNPTDWIYVRDNTLEQKPKFAIRYYAWWDDVENLQMYDIELYTKDEIINYEGTPVNLREVRRRTHHFNGLPVIEFMENESRQGSYENVINLIDTYELMLSDTANTINYFSDCYLVLTGMQETQAEDIAKMKNDRVLLVPEGCEASFLTKNVSENYNENMLKRLQEQIFTVACTPLLSDSSFSSNSSGVAIQFKLFAMEKSVQLKENIFRTGFNNMFNLIRDMINLLDRKGYTEDDRVIQTYTRSLPMDLSSLSDSISKLKDVVSRRTLMTQLDFVSDASLEEEQLRVEKEEEMMFEAQKAKVMFEAVPQQTNNTYTKQEGETNNE
ncbi:MAG: phage portal protein [Romboutsia timonensis]